MGRSFYLKWRDCTGKLAGFEANYNAFTLNPYAHIFLDNGIIALKFLSSNDHNGKHYATIMIQWLPVCNPLTKAKAILESNFPHANRSSGCKAGIDLGYEPGSSLCADPPNTSSSLDYWSPIQEAIAIIIDLPQPRSTAQVQCPACLTDIAVTSFPPVTPRKDDVSDIDQHNSQNDSFPETYLPTILYLLWSLFSGTRSFFLLLRNTELRVLMPNPSPRNPSLLM